MRGTGQPDQLCLDRRGRHHHECHKSGGGPACRGRPGVPLIGLTYPDVILGGYVYPKQPATASTLSLAKLSVVAFKSLINPALTKAYVPAQGSLVDVTKATGAYVPLTHTVRYRPYGTIPAAVASVCTLTWFCAQGNIHATTKGYTLIGKLVVARYNMRRA